MPIATPQGTLDFKSVDKVTFVGASSNTVIDTTTGSLGVGVGVGGPTSNLHVVGNTRLEGDINMLHTSNTASIKLNSNVVTEFSRSKKLIKYPRVVLPRSAVGSTYNDYRIDRSSEHVTGSYVGVQDLFNNTATDGNDTWGAGWQGSSGSYSTSTGQHSTYVTGGTTQGTGARLASNVPNGEWVSLQLPNAIQLNHVKIRSRNGADWKGQFPLDFEFWGSNNNGTTWSHIKSFSDIAAAGQATFSTFQVESTQVYSRIALVVTKIIGAGGYTASAGHAHFSISELHLYGVPEYDPEADGTDVTIKSVPNVPNTDWLEVYYDAKNYTSGVVQDLSTNSFNGTLTNGASYNNSDGIDKFVFDAGTNQYMTTTTNISGSAFIHTTSMWVKFVEVSTDSNDQHFLFNLGAWGSNSIGMYYSANQGIRVATGFDYRTQYHPVAGRWFHVSYTYAGGAHGTAAMNTTVKFYINGQQWNIPAYYGGTTTVTLPSSSVLQINGSAGNNNTLMDMEVANFRLFNRALSSDEIYQLYAYQKEDFGHGDLSMTLKAGRLGIGTSEPRADLDVRGDVCMKLQGYFELNQGTRPAASTTSHGMRWTNTDNTNHWHLFNSDNEHFRFVYNGVAKGYVDPNDANAQMNFTGQHRTFIKDIPFTRVIELEGLIVSADNNKYIKMSGGIEVGSNAITTNESLPVVSLSNVVTDKKCFGVISASEDPEQRSDAYGSFITPFDKEKGDTRVYINSVGEGAIWVSNIDGNLESGDYITTSNIVGYGQKQEGAGLMNYTVAKITMDCDFEPATQPIQIIKKDETGENVLDEHDQIQWEDHPTETEKAYKIKYLDASGVETDEANAVHTAAFVGCTYHCG